jgi:hypothetical protein
MSPFAEGIKIVSVTHMSHAVGITSSRFQQLFAGFFHIFQQATRSPTLACVAYVLSLGR